MYPLRPILSEADPELSSEGGIDPLGLYAIADALAVRLVPGVRERQLHPRFLTAMAVSLELCQKYEGQVAADEVTPPRRVFEWYFVEGMVRQAKGEVVGVPGSLKAAAAIGKKIPLSAGQYLKTPEIFGFHGIYKLLARELGIESNDQLNARGHELLEVWSDEQELAGFRSGRSGDGWLLRSWWDEAIKVGLAKGATDRSDGWLGWELFPRHLGHGFAGPRESAILVEGLLSEEKPLRRQLLEFLVSAEAQHLLAVGGTEREFHTVLRQRSGGALGELLDAIGVYEKFARLLIDAFQTSLTEMTDAGRGVDAQTLSELPAVQKAASEVPGLYPVVLAKLQPFGQAVRFMESFSNLSNALPVADWLSELMGHHRRVQQVKPPAGKNAWFETFDDGRFMIRPLYLTDGEARMDDLYVHTYRLRPLQSFSRDLGLLRL